MTRLRILLFGAGVTAILLGASILHGKKDRSARGCELYWMPYCPYGQEAARQMLAAFAEEPTSDGLRFVYIANEHSPGSGGNPSPKKAGGGGGCEQQQMPQTADWDRFSSLHGRRETEESVRQIVVRNLWPRSFRGYLKAFLARPDGEWESRAESAGIPREELARAMESPAARTWFSQNIRAVRDRGIRFSPTLVVDGRPVEKFPGQIQDLRAEVCASSLAIAGCEEFQCSAGQPCAPRRGMVAECEQGRCAYRPEPLREDAVGAYLIVPENCVPAEEFPIEEALLGWKSFLRITRIGLSDPKAQDLMRRSEVDAFPVLVVEPELTRRSWGTQCLEQLHLRSQGAGFQVVFHYSSTPFASYARILREKEILRVEPDHYMGALFLHRTGRYQAAAKSYHLALAANASDYRAWNNYGALLYDHLGLPATAGEMFNRAVTLNPAYEPALGNLIRFESSRKNEPALAAAREKLAWLALGENRSEEARALFAQIASHRLWEFSARKGLAVIALREDRLPEALSQLERCLEIESRPDGDFSNLLAGVYFRMSNQDRAIEWYERAIKAGEEDGQAFPNLCHLLEVAGRWPQLLNAAERARALHPKETAFGFFQARALVRMGRPRDAVRVLLDLGRVFPDAAFRASYELAGIYGEQNECAAAMQYARQFVQGVPPALATKLGDECLEIGRLAQRFQDHHLAVAALTQALRARPSNAEAHRMLADSYGKLGETARTREHLVLAAQFGGGKP